MGTQIFNLFILGVGIVLCLLVLIALFLGIQVLLMPFYLLFNKFHDKHENSTAISEKTYITGTISTDLSQNKTTELVVTGGGLTKNVYPTKLYDNSSDIVIPKHSEVLIVEIKEGIAYVDKYTDFLKDK